MISVSIDKRVFNPVYLPYLNSEKRFQVFYGGAGSGKSYFVAEKGVFKLLTLPQMNWLIVRKTGDTNRYSTFSLLQQVIAAWKVEKLFTVRQSDMTITCINGNSVIFKGLDDREKLKSITFPRGAMTHIWIEEASEIDEEDFNQLNVRLRGGNVKKQIILSFNPISVTHWLKARFFDREVKNADILHTTYRDNLFIDDEYKRELEAFRETDEYYYSVYCLGEWGVIGKTVFSAKNVHLQLAKKVRPIMRGYFTYLRTGGRLTNISFTEDENGFISVYEMPETGFPYVIGGDTAGEGSDFFVGQVLNNVSGFQAAVLRMETDEDLYAEQMFCLGMWYNRALLGIERNYSTHPVRVLENLCYPNQYMQIDEDRFTHKAKPIFGFNTNRATRPMIIASLVRVMREEPETIVDRATLEEMLTFVRNEKGRAEAQEGKHDDCIMALCIAVHLRQSAAKKAKGKDLPPVKWEDDIWTDYYNADEDARAKMIETLGNPFGTE